MHETNGIEQNLMDSLEQARAEIKALKEAAEAKKADEPVAAAPAASVAATRPKRARK